MFGNLMKQKKKKRDRKARDYIHLVALYTNLQLHNCQGRKNQLQIVPRFSFNESLDFALNPKIVSFFSEETITNKETTTKLRKNKSQETTSQEQNII